MTPAHVLTGHTHSVRYSSVMASPGESSLPHPPPEAVLLRLARKAAGVTVAQAAHTAGVSKAWLSAIENGYDNRGRDGVRPVRASDEIVARLAAFLDVGPERLETEGQRPDAAAVLREMQRHTAQQPAPVAEPRFADPRLQNIMDGPGDLDWKLMMVALAQAVLAHQEPQDRSA